MSVHKLVLSCILQRLLEKTAGSGFKYVFLVRPDGLASLNAAMLATATSLTSKTSQAGTSCIRSVNMNLGGCRWLIAIAFWLSGGFIKSGLGSRIAYTIVSLFGKTTLGLTYSLVFAEALLAPAIPSVSTLL